MTEYERGLRDITEWLEVSRPEHIPWKIQVCLDNYPSDPRHQPYYDAMLTVLQGEQAVTGRATVRPCDHYYADPCFCLSMQIDDTAQAIAVLNTGEECQCPCHSSR